METIRCINSMAVVQSDNPTALINKCTIQVRNFDGGIKPLQLYRRNGNFIEIPRALVKPKNLDYYLDIPTPEKIDIKFTSELKPHQISIVNKVINSYNNKDLGGILKAGTGTGKSVMALYIAAYLGIKTIIIVPLKRIVQQWKDMVLKFTDIKEEEIGIVEQNRCEYKGKKIVIAMLPSLAARKDEGYPKNLYKSFGLTIWDEGHVLGAETFSKVVPLFHDRYRLMLSATPRRKDGAENVFKFHIGDVVAEFDRVMLTPKVIVVVNKALKYSGVNFVWNKKFMRSRYLNFLSKDLERNTLIANYIKKLIAKERNVIVMSDRIIQLKTLAKLVNIPHGRCYENYKELDKNLVFATYGSMGMAVDAPHFDTIILATPRSDVEQAVGRVLREAEGKKSPVVIDILDYSCIDMKKSFKGRNKYYNKVGAKIVNVKGIGG